MGRASGLKLVRMKTKKRTKSTEITFERSEVFVVRRAKKTSCGWCSRCAAQVGMCTPDEAAALARVSTRTIYRWIEAGRVHFTETAEGLLLVCLSSIFEKEIKR